MFHYPPFAAPDRLGAAAVSIREGAADPPADDDFPPIEQFIDDLPSIDIYLAEEARYIAPEPPPQMSAAPAQNSEGWAISGWQSYDWTGLASLGRQTSEKSQAESEWNATEWSGPAPEHDPTGFFDDVDTFAGTPAGGVHFSGPSANEVAAALDAIARRIRSGEISIDPLRGMPPEAAMAAALAAMMKLRG